MIELYDKLTDKLEPYMQDLKLYESMYETVAAGKYSSAFDNLTRKIFGEGYIEGIRKTLEILKEVLENYDKEG